MFFSGLLSAQSMTDSRDGKTYKTLEIGNQTWMAENLNFGTGSSSWCYNNKKRNAKKYGRLYDWQTAQNVCPSGWRLPSKNDFKTLITDTGGSGSNAYKALLTSGSSGFSALLGGGRNCDGSFDGIGSRGGWWSSSEGGTNGAWGMDISSDIQIAIVYNFDYNELGYSVRCIKN
jgi:uncharacterized protein (TIGR02145 family)